MLDSVIFSSPGKFPQNERKNESNLKVAKKLKCIMSPRDTQQIQNAGMRTKEGNMKTFC